MAQVLCSIVLLEDNTPRQVFTEFLLARTVSCKYAMEFMFVYYMLLCLGTALILHSCFVLYYFDFLNGFSGTRDNRKDL